MPFFFARKSPADTLKNRVDAIEMKMATMELAWLETLAMLKKAAGRAYAERKADKGEGKPDDVAPGRTNGHKLSPEVDRWVVRG